MNCSSLALQMLGGVGQHTHLVCAARLPGQGEAALVPPEVSDRPCGQESVLAGLWLCRAVPYSVL